MVLIRMINRVELVQHNTVSGTIVSKCRIQPRLADRAGQNTYLDHHDY